MKTVIFINAGHGGMDTNGKNHTDPKAGKQTLHTNGKTYHKGSWFYEGAFNRQIAAEFQIVAENAGFECVRVYDELVDIPRRQRTSFANKLAMQFNAQGKMCVWLSFHANAATNSTAPQHSAEGVCVLVYKLGSATATLAGLICKAVENVFDKWGSKRRSQLVFDKVNGKGLDETTFTAMPSMLFEIGFFDNPKNADLLINPVFRAEVVAEMVRVIQTVYK